MLCVEFEDRLTDHLDGLLDNESQIAFNEHALRCPVCHDLLSEVKNMIRVVRTDVPPTPSAGLEARILLQTAPESAMTCDEFEEYLTDYLDGFLPAPLYHRWQRHAALCQRCTDLPGEVVRSIGACYSYISEEQIVPAGLHERILQATLGTTEAEQLRAPLAARIEEWLRGWLDVVVSPQLAMVATMLLVAILVGTSTLSDDGSIGGMYRTSLRFAAQTYAQTNSARSTALPGDLKRMTDGLENLVGAPSNTQQRSETQPQTTNQHASGEKADQQKH